MLVEGGSIQLANDFNDADSKPLATRGPPVAKNGACRPAFRRCRRSSPAILMIKGSPEWGDGCYVTLASPFRRPHFAGGDLARPVIGRTSCSSFTSQRFTAWPRGVRAPWP